MNKKAQAAVEYLATYGWTILVILITVGMIIYFDVLSPIKFIPEQCEFGDQVLCQDMIIYDGVLAAEFQLNLINHFPKGIVIIDAQSQDYPAGFTCDFSADAGGDGLFIDTANPGTLKCNFPDGTFFPVGEKQQVKLMILFRRAIIADGPPGIDIDESNDVEDCSPPVFDPKCTPYHEVRGTFVTTVEP
ncbi:MAG: hypothetical protein KKG59_02880 [Nanoarchaeota archaeon]|nr:hypothetical protein [Nanoarchaeota archaeon]